MAELTIEHNAGFFSCCSVRLSNIISFFNDKKRLPHTIDCSQQFYCYKDNHLEDINNTFFSEREEDNIVFETSIDYHWEHQFIPYCNLDFNTLTPFIKKYFNISQLVRTIVERFEQTYNINYTNTIAVFYRGNDKCTETRIGSYEEYFDKAEELNIKFPNSIFLIQTDESEFRDEFKTKFPNSFYFEEIPVTSHANNKVMHNIVQQSNRKHFGALFLAATLCISKCNAIITHSGNCGIFAVLYRGNSKNVFQYLTSGWV